MNSQTAHNYQQYEKNHAGHGDEHSGMHGSTHSASQHSGREAHANHAGHESGHGAHVDHTGHEQMFRKRFWVSLVLTIPVLLFSPMVQQWLDFNMPEFPGSQLIGPLFAIAIFFYGGVPFLQMAVPEVRNRKPGMMTLISLAITVAFVYSAFALFAAPGSGFFWEMATLIDVMLLGHWIEMRSVRQASGALNELAKLMPDTAERILPNGETEEVPVGELKKGDLVLVRPGGSVPADGVVEYGHSDVNEAMITGESKPVSKKPGDQVIGGTINSDGSLRVRVTATGDDTALAGIMRLVDQAQQSKSNTGTLTEGQFGVVAMATVDGRGEKGALALAAAVEGDSEHLIAAGIRRKAAEHNVAPLQVSNFEAIKGRGIRATQDGHAVYVGGPRLLEMLKLDLPDTLSRFTDETGTKGQSVVYLVGDQQVIAAFALADVIRPESRRAVERLHEMGVEVAMLTGDSEAVASAVADELGIDTYFAEVLPERKDQKVAALQKQGKKVAMVGDGVNDAPALTRADVGIAIGSGTDVAIESAGIILVQSNPLDVVKIFELSRATYRKMIQNLIWATGYNVVALPLAAGVLAPIGFLLSPAVGALFMSLSTVIVAINAQLLRRVQLAA